MSWFGGKYTKKYLSVKENYVCTILASDAGKGDQQSWGGWLCVQIFTQIKRERGEKGKEEKER